MDEYGIKLREDVLRKLQEMSADRPKDVCRYNRDEAGNERAFDSLLILLAAAVVRQSCGIAMHRQPQNNCFCIALLEMTTSSR